MVVYNASKFGAVGLSAAARVEYRDSGVSVSAVLPGAVRTELASGVTLGAGLPTVDPEDVAKAILSTVKTRRAETPVPRYLALWSRLGALIPERVVNLGRRLANDRRGLEEIDAVGRQAYDDRLKRHAG
jgi:short-subunit dehydrogenase